MRVNFETPLIAALFVADQASKYLVQANLPWQRSVAFIPGFMNWYYTRNTGAAFSIFYDQRWLLVFIAVIVLAVMLVFRRQLTEGNAYLRLAWALVMAGALGNLCDRILAGSVVDFLEFDFFRFPIFNIADIAITCGGVIYIAVMLYLEWQKVER